MSMPDGVTVVVPSSFDAAMGSRKLKSKTATKRKTAKTTSAAAAGKAAAQTAKATTPKGGTTWTPWGLEKALEKAHDDTLKVEYYKGGGAG